MLTYVETENVKSECTKIEKRHSCELVGLFFFFNIVQFLEFDIWKHK